MLSQHQKLVPNQIIQKLKHNVFFGARIPRTLLPSPPEWHFRPVQFPAPAPTKRLPQRSRIQWKDNRPTPVLDRSWIPAKLGAGVAIQ